MAKLGFLKAYRALVSAGKKTTTLRRWKRPMLRAGQIVDSTGIGRLRIAAVDVVQWEALTESDARADGFDSLADLLAAVQRIYPDWNGDGRSWFKVRFRVVGKRAGSQPKRARRVDAGAIRHRSGTFGGMNLADKRKLARVLRHAAPLVA